MKTGLVGIGSMGGMLVRALVRSQALAAGTFGRRIVRGQSWKALAAEFPGIHVAELPRAGGQLRFDFSLSATRGRSQRSGSDGSGTLSWTVAGDDGQPDSSSISEDRVPCRVGKVIPSIPQEIGAGVALLMYGTRATSDEPQAA